MPLLAGAWVRAQVFNWVFVATCGFLTELVLVWEVVPCFSAVVETPARAHLQWSMDEWNSGFNRKADNQNFPDGLNTLVTLTTG